MSGRDWIWVSCPKLIPQTLKDIALDVCFERGIPLDELKGRSALQHYARPRQEFMWRAYETGRYTTTHIARFLERDPSTISHGVHAHSARKAVDGPWKVPTPA